MRVTEIQVQSLEVSHGLLEIEVTRFELLLRFHEFANVVTQKRFVPITNVFETLALPSLPLELFFQNGDPLF